MTNERLLRIRHIVGDRKRGIPGIVNVSAATWWRWVAEGKAPKPLHLGPMIRAWRESEVRAFVQRLIEDGQGPPGKAQEKEKAASGARPKEVSSEAANPSLEPC